MQNLFEMMTNAQNGQAVELMARQYNLTQQQTQLALEALLPAFSQGLKRNASDPYGVGSFLSALSSGQHAQYFDDAAKAFSPAGTAEGNGILGHLFGSKELSRAVTQQAAQATGIGQDVLKQMLPALAAMVMGGLFKQSTGQMGGQMNAGQMNAASNPLGEIIEQMMKQGMGGARAAPQPQAPANPFDNPLGKILEGMFGGGAAAPEPARKQAAPQNPLGDNPWGKILEEMMGGGTARQTTRTSRPEPEPAPRKNPSGRARNPYDDIFGEMFETGKKATDDYQKGVESIFEQFTKGMDRYR